MSLSRVTVTGVRNLQPVTLSPSPRINILHGANGSGKTSVLEALHLLGLARSFRSVRLAPVIQYEQPACTVFGQVQLADGRQSNLGIARERNGEFQIRIDGQSARSAAQLADALPLQLINPDSFRLLEGAPKIRRQFLDWGVFHVEQRFLPAWQRLQKALRQRNSWLRHGTLDGASQAAWDRELCLASDEIDGYRRAYIKALKPVFEQTLGELVELEGLTLSYYRGWDKDRALNDVLSASLVRDQQIGHTQSGPQRADLRLRLGSHNAADILSRGQQKLVICALRIAQGHLVDQAKRGQCIYLVDDLPSELDEQHRGALCRLLEDLHCQVFITCVDHELLREGWRTDTPVAMFHVEHGCITQTHDHRE
ncbi:MAG: DNA replication/repair protein RecF [Gammaproteobacteria bacterium]|nr:DNA replication/repair protein RecF [Gammaproteobacteria bacterium]MBU1490383.1 DNA replication/repair protein RecF [Gammaproteobacteria bacterium]MBU2066342.1 DNA replication/repair protein RecF [Gammaproteobacteria bacterium]MBU2139760.1 DNA replication/repair protein RecF [Gammaproteobacteria bacterium]MBU2215986.1 DNA replication/repair protein RecF [Gammaproteobacteria bacterium]